MDGKLDLLAILELEFRAHPGLAPEDLRKLVVQSIFGGDHLLKDPARFRDGLFREWMKLPVAPRSGRTAAVQPISPDGLTARLHLGPCKAGGVMVDELAEALLAQPRKNGSRSDFARRWADVIELAEVGRIPLEDGDLRDLSSLEALPHHSPGYGAASYRVINNLQDPSVAEWLRTWAIGWT